LSGSDSGLLSGSGLFNISGMGSIGSLVSGLVNLFGGDSSKPAPLPSFSLPGSQIQNVAVHGVTAATIRTSGTTDSTYAQLPDLHNSGRSLADQSQQIAQAVKTALLQSHSLTDVISEL
jgi:hypothetical protein